jgi:osmotically-inducible protein OsmY
MNAKPILIAGALAGLIACASNQAPEVSGRIREQLRTADLRSVTVSQDRTKGVVTLGGSVRQDADKGRAEQIAGLIAAGQVVADQIAVLPPGYEATVRSVDSSLDKGIEANLDAALLQANVKGLHHSTTNGVVTLTGNLDSPVARAEAARVAAGVPNVQQVVNEIDVRNWHATSTPPGRE